MSINCTKKIYNFLHDALLNRTVNSGKGLMVAVPVMVIGSSIAASIASPFLIVDGIHSASKRMLQCYAGFFPRTTTEEPDSVSAKVDELKPSNFK